MVGILTITASDGHLRIYHDAVRRLGSSDAQTAYQRALNRTATMAKTRVVRAISQTTSIKGAVVRAQTRVHRALKGSNEASIIGTGATIPLRDMGARQTLSGVTARIYGRTQRFPGMFIMAGTPRSGNPAYKGHVLHNVRAYNPKSGRNNLAIVQFGPSVPGGMRSAVVRKEFDTVVETILPARLIHEIGRLLPK